VIHYSCDRCQRIINVEHDVRYSVSIEVQAAIEPLDTDVDEDRDHLLELQNILEKMSDAEREEISQNAYQHHSYDLCSDCHRQFVKNPLAVDTAGKLQFSDN
jgi:hypothetical protein